MIFVKVQVLSVLLFHMISSCNSFLDPVTITALGGTVAALYVYLSGGDNNNNIIKHVVKKIGQKLGAFEGCEDYWIPANIEGLEFDVRSTVYGQPLALEVIINALRHHLHRDIEPDRPLILSLHGGPGTGKNFIAQKILKNMFIMGGKSDYTIFFKGSIDFPVREKKEQYKEDIVKKIKEKVYECHRSIFVFDEVDKMHDGLLDILSGFVKIGRYQDYDFRRTIFVLLSNTGSEYLTAKTIEHIYYGGLRDEMDPVELGNKLQQHSYNKNGGLRNTGLVQGFGITHYVPFLPLEKHHIIQCLEKVVSRLNQTMSNELISQVLSGIAFQPENYPVFSPGGCKGLEDRVVMIIERERRRKLTKHST